MPADLAELIDLLRPKQLSRGSFEAPAPSHSLLAKTYGGQYLAQAMGAAEAALGEPFRAPHAVLGTFLSAGQPAEPAVVEVDALRDGRSFSTRQVLLSQGKRHLFEGTISFHTPERGFFHQPELPDAPHPDRCMPLNEAIAWAGHSGGEMWEREWPMVDFRYAGGAMTPEGRLRSDVPTSQRLWVRINQPLPDDEALHRRLICYLSDAALIVSALIPHGTFVTVDSNPRASLNHGLWLHDSVRADEWMLFDQSSPWAGGGRALAVSHIYSLTGKLAASATQEGLFRMVRAPR